jgi:hypothetical protein
MKLDDLVFHPWTVQGPRDVLASFAAPVVRHRCRRSKPTSSARSRPAMHPTSGLSEIAGRGSDRDRLSSTRKVRKMCSIWLPRWLYW